MNKIDRLEKILDVVKAQEELGLAKAKSLIGDVRKVEIPDIPVPDFFKKEEVVVEKKKFNWGLLIAVIVGALIAGAYTYFLVPDKYTATSKMYMVSASSDAVVNLSKIPAREVLLARLIGSIHSGVANLVYCLNAIAKKNEEASA